MVAFFSRVTSSWCEWVVQHKDRSLSGSWAVVLVHRPKRSNPLIWFYCSPLNYSGSQGESSF